MPLFHVPNHASTRPIPVWRVEVEVVTKQHDREIKKLLEYTNNHILRLQKLLDFYRSSKRQLFHLQLWRSPAAENYYLMRRKEARDIADVRNWRNVKPHRRKGQSALKFYYDDMQNLHGSLWSIIQKAQRDFLTN